MLKRLSRLYGLRFANTVVYMLQSSEYRAADYLNWLWRVEDFSKVTYRRQLVKTRAATALLRALQLGISLTWLLGFFLIYVSVSQHGWALLAAAVTLLVATPFIWSHLAVVPLELGRLLVAPKHKKQIGQSAEIFAKHPGVKIAIAGSYGKTSMKEILKIILSGGKKVAATVGNQNIAISHSRFARSLSGDEEVLIIEYGEGAPGDVEKFARTTSPDIGIITGLAPAHLDQYKTLDAAAKDIFSLAKYLGGNEVYVNNDSAAAKPYIEPEYHLFDGRGALGWAVSDVQNDITGLRFRLSKADKVISLNTAIVGRHMIGPVTLACALGDKLGLDATTIEQAATSIRPYEHRMQPYQLGGGWVIDDTYNGNIDGVKAGLALLKELPAKRKIYVTPGLVDQGDQTAEIHRQIGALIADANPDKVVLIAHSTTKFIKDGLAKAGFNNEVVVEDDPLLFYSNLDQIIAAGDLVLMQNDWTDNYN